MDARLRKRIIFGASVILALGTIFLGGGKLLIYLGLFITGLFLGMKFKDAKQFYQDYRLGLRINAIQYSAKQTLAMQDELKKLKEDLNTATQRLQIYQHNNKPQGAINLGNQRRNGPAGLWEDEQAL